MDKQILLRMNLHGFCEQKSNETEVLGGSQLHLEYAMLFWSPHLIGRARKDTRVIKMIISQKMKSESPSPHL